MVLITGANGFIGSVLAWDCFQHWNPALKSSQLLLLDSVPPAERPGLLRGLPQAQFFNISQLEKALSQRPIECVFHLGAISSTTETNWERLQDNNVLLSQKLFQWCADQQVPLVYASSAATYGDGSSGYSDSLSPEQLKPLNLYGKSKNVFDQWALAQKKTPPHWYGVKFFNVYGPNELYKGPMASLVYKSFLSIRNTGKIQLFRSHRADYKDGEQKRDFVYVKDVTRWMRELLLVRPPSGLYNFGSGQARTWLDLANSVFSSLQLAPKIEFVDVPLSIRNQYQYFTEAPMQKAFLAGLSRPKYSLEAGVQEYIQLLKSCQGMV